MRVISISELAVVMTQAWAGEKRVKSIINEGFTLRFERPHASSF